MPSGRFYLVVGPSGAGKDTLLDAAKDRLNGEGNFYFPRRYVTRPQDSGGEDHIAVDLAEFEALEKAGEFACQWGAHGLRYALPRDINRQLREGVHVVANVSRSVIDELRKRYHPVLVLAVSVQPEILSQRLQSRGREDEDDIRRRLARAVAYQVEGDDVLIIDNSDDLSQSLQNFMDALRQEDSV